MTTLCAWALTVVSLFPLPVIPASPSDAATARISPVVAVPMPPPWVPKWASRPDLAKRATFGPAHVVAVAPIEPSPERAEPPETTTTTTAPQVHLVLTGDVDLEKLRQCEASGSYTVVDKPNGKYRGAYQFDFPTWDAVAGRNYPHLVGVDPIDASPHEQDAMAIALWNERGPAPWPHCGPKSIIK